MATVKAKRTKAAHQSATPAVAPSATEIAKIADGYTLTGFPTATSIKRVVDNTLKETRVAYFRGIVAAQPIARRGIYDFVLRPDVFVRLHAEAPEAASAITQAAQQAIAVQALPAELRPAPATACLMPGAIIPDKALAEAAAALHHCGIITVRGPDSPMRAAILATPGHVSFAGLTFLKNREGGGTISDHLYWPHKSRLPDAAVDNASGVTLGLGYDMKLRDKDTITEDLVGIGLDRNIAAAAADGYHRTHADAHGFANRNENLVRLTDDQQMRLLALIIGTYETTVRRLVEADMAARLLVCEFDALVSMNYQGALAPPVLRPVKSHDLVAAGVAIVSTTSANYLARRQLEQALFDRAVYNAGAAG